MVQKLVGREDAAVRCSHWNGCDLSSQEGVDNVIMHLETKTCLGVTGVWPILTSPSYINQRTDSQKQALMEKRKKALQQYLGASAIYMFCVQEGIHVTWEWAQRCQAWRLPFVQDLQRGYSLGTCVVHGCRVQLRCPKTHNLMGKGWKLMSTSTNMLETMNMPCRCGPNYIHGKCDGTSAYYTDMFVKQVAKIMIMERMTR